MRKQITVAQLADELRERVNQSRDIECCKEEILSLAALAKEKIGQEMIEVDWKE